jgi:hypothetical protein
MSAPSLTARRVLGNAAGVAHDTVYSYSMTTLADLATHFELFAVCGPCRRMVRFDVRQLADTLGGDCTTDAVRARVRCRTCGRRTNDIRIVYAGRCGGARGFHYRRTVPDDGATLGSEAPPAGSGAGGASGPS